MKITRKHPYGRRTIARDAHKPTEIYVETVTDDGPGIRRNAAIRNEGFLKVGQRMPALEDHADVAVAFQFPTVMDYQREKALHADLFAELELGGDCAIRAGEKLAILLPQYVTTIRRGDRTSAR